MLKALDFLLTFVHLFIIGFNLFGWIWPKTRRLHFWFAMLTLGCWTILGIWFGLGYCPVTDWQWGIKKQLGEQNLPASFIKYLADQATGINFSPTLIDVFTLGLFLIAIAISVKLNFLSRKPRS